MSQLKGNRTGETAETPVYDVKKAKDETNEMIYLFNDFFLPFESNPLWDSKREKEKKATPTTLINYPPTIKSKENLKKI